MFSLRFPKWLCFLPFICLSPISIYAAGSAVGTWKNADATFQIYEESGKLCAKILTLREPNTPDGKPKLDVHNPDASKRSRPLIGLVFMGGFLPVDDKKWDHGTIYDPKSGNTYSCTMELQSADKLKVRGYMVITLLGRTDIWTRIR
jgi:uncharacterized protein (DUF2147 family)